MHNSEGQGVALCGQGNGQGIWDAQVKVTMSARKIILRW